MNLGALNKVAARAVISFLLVLLIIIVPVILSTSDGVANRLQSKAERPSDGSQIRTRSNATVKSEFQKNTTFTSPSEQKTSSTADTKKRISPATNQVPTEQTIRDKIPATSPSVNSPTSSEIVGAPTTSKTEIPTFRNVFSPSNDAGWYEQTSGSKEKIIQTSDYFECTVGGYDSSLHHARLQRSLPNEDKLALTKNVSAEIDFEIPDDFYERQESFVRIFSFDNYADFIKGTNQKLGSDEANEWRLGLVIYNSDKLLRLDSEHTNNENLTLWQIPAQLEPGQHKIKFEVSLSQDNAGSWSIWVDDKYMGSATNVQTIPSTLIKPEERELTQLTTCLDGSSSQDTTSLSLRVRSILTSGS